MANTIEITQYKEKLRDVQNFKSGQVAKSGDTWKIQVKKDGVSDGTYAFMETFGHGGEIDISFDGSVLTYAHEVPGSVTINFEVTVIAITGHNVPYIEAERCRDKRFFIKTVFNGVTKTHMFQKIEPF